MAIHIFRGYRWVVELAIGVAALLLSVCSGCSSSDDGGTKACSAQFRTSGGTIASVAGYEATVSLDLTAPAGTEYLIRVESGGDWCWTSRKEQSTEKQDRMAAENRVEKLYIAANKTTEERRAVISVTFGSDTEISLELRQAVDDNVPSSYDRNWVELPAYPQEEQMVVVTHYAPIGVEKVVRNYTLCFDTEKGYAVWAAYPLHKCYMQGTYNRTNDWQYDPKIPTNYQTDLSIGSYKGSWVRGHQVMSNHRYSGFSDELNAQTFYSTNIMPQHGGFNSGLWNEVEAACTNKGMTTGTDTLYCVTGAWGSQGTTSDKAGKEITIPAYCFKVMLKARSNKNATPVEQITDPSQLMAIGYWAPNSSEGNTGKASNFMCSVAEVEQKTGYTFFPMLNSAVVEEVKAQNKPSEWGIN